MKKKIITAAIAILALCSMPAMAQTDNSTSTENAKKECRKVERKGNIQEMRAARDFQRKDAFDGIQLTDAQKAGLKAIVPDTTSTRPNFRQAKRDYVNNVKNVLTPEQYVVFLENIVVDNAQLPIDRPNKDMRRGGHDKKHHAFDRGRRMEKSKRDLKGNKAEKTASATVTQ